MTGCEDINECEGGHGCDANAHCSNTKGHYTCTCIEGFTGDGQECTIIFLTLGFSNDLRLTAVEGSLVVLTVQVAGVLTTHIFATVIVTPGSASHNDFNVLPSTELNFSPGVEEVGIVIAIKNDSINENDEVFVLTIASSNASVHVDKDKGVTIVTVLDETKHSSSSNRGILIGAIVATVIIFVLVLLIVAHWCYRRNRNVRERETKEDIGLYTVVPPKDVFKS